MVDIPVVMWKKKLAEWADNHAIHINQYRKVKNDV